MEPLVQVILWEMATVISVRFEYFLIHFSCIKTNEPFELKTSNIMSDLWDQSKSSNWMN